MAHNSEFGGERILEKSGRCYISSSSFSFFLKRKCPSKDTLILNELLLKKKLIYFPVEACTCVFLCEAPVFFFFFFFNWSILSLHFWYNNNHFIIFSPFPLHLPPYPREEEKKTPNNWNSSLGKKILVKYTCCWWNILNTSQLLWLSAFFEERVSNNYETLKVTIKGEVENLPWIFFLLGRRLRKQGFWLFKILVLYTFNKLNLYVFMSLFTKALSS